jgi:hypothetical protein
MRVMGTFLSKRPIKGPGWGEHRESVYSIDPGANGGHLASVDQPTLSLRMLRFFIPDQFSKDMAGLTSESVMNLSEVLAINK